MNVQITLLALIFGCLLLLTQSCSTGGVKSHDSKSAIDKIMIDKNIDTTNIKYQYYQKYGFTDLCEHFRIATKLDSIPELINDLPISDKDRDLVNKMLEKSDSLKGDSYLTNYHGRHIFSDIELDFFEYQTDSNLILDLTEGKYELKLSDLESELIIYDNKNKLIYYEIHRCDGR